MALMKLAVLFTLLASAATPQSMCIVEGQTTQAVQAAIDSCSAKGGGVAYLPPGQ
jgi:hypothetical protein